MVKLLLMMLDSDGEMDDSHETVREPRLATIVPSRLSSITDNNDYHPSFD